MTRQLEEGQPFFQVLRALYDGRELGHSFLFLILAFPLLSSLCQEIAFRGFILSGLQRRFRPRAAVILTSFLFALWHMNVFLFVPAFFLGVVLGLITIRSKSLLPAILFHFVHDTVLLISIRGAHVFADQLPPYAWILWCVAIALCVTIALGLLWWLYRKPYVDLERKEREQPKTT